MDKVSRAVIKTEGDKLIQSSGVESASGRPSPTSATEKNDLDLIAELENEQFDTALQTVFENFDTGQTAFTVEENESAKTSASSVSPSSSIEQHPIQNSNAKPTAEVNDGGIDSTSTEAMPSFKDVNQDKIASSKPNARVAKPVVHSKPELHSSVDKSNGTIRISHTQFNREHCECPTRTNY